ncbi:MAG TPA: DUF1674 domain-containing protein [Roseiarcus sp.]|nr:DUF1674 domain-containing protein [Roseiarcus sp.]
MAAADSGPAAKVEQEKSAAKAEGSDRSDAAARALAEAEERRLRETTPRPREFAGRGGLEPVRYGDWEVKGIASDF